MSSYFCETIFRCPTLYILSDKPINESLITDYYIIVVNKQLKLNKLN